jgi:hypothetical protein
MKAETRRITARTGAACRDATDVTALFSSTHSFCPAGARVQSLARRICVHRADDAPRIVSQPR